jgi:hypothetical protein
MRRPWLWLLAWVPVWTAAGVLDWRVPDGAARRVPCDCSRVIVVVTR